MARHGARDEDDVLLRLDADHVLAPAGLLAATGDEATADALLAGALLARPAC